MSNVLLLGGGTQGLVLIKDMKRAGHDVFLIGEKHNYAGTSRYLTAAVHPGCQCTDEAYLELVKAFIAEHGISVVIPTGDLTAGFLSRNKAELQELVSFVMPDYEDFKRATDKNELMKVCEAGMYPHPRTIATVDSVEGLKESDLHFPLLIKPNVTCGARGMVYVSTYQELCERFPRVTSEYGPCHLQEYVRRGGAQVEVQLYVDEEKRLLQSSVIYKHRWYPEQGGSSCCARSVKNDRIVTILHRLLVDLNWVGFADFDTVEDPDTGELLILELNPRVPACVKCPVEAGVRWGEILVNAYLHKEQKRYAYRENVYLRHLGFEVLWFLRSRNRFRTKPSWFKFFGGNIHYQDMGGISDPFPFLAGTLHNIHNLFFHSSK